MRLICIYVQFVFSVEVTVQNVSWRRGENGAIGQVSSSATHRFFVFLLHLFSNVNDMTGKVSIGVSPIHGAEAL